jgi:hypothetical protein
MTRDEMRLVARLLCHAGQDPERLAAKAEKDKERQNNAAVQHLRDCVRESFIMEKYQKIKEALHAD